MNIKIRLSIQFTLLVFFILLFFSALVYYFSYTSQRAKFRGNLLDQAQNTAILLINVEEVDSTLLKKIQDTTRLLEKEEIALTNSSGKIIYSYRMNYLNDELLKNYPDNLNPVYFSIDNMDAVSYRHILKGQIYHVFVLAYDNYRADNLHELRKILFWCILFSIWLSVSASYFFSKIAIKPISAIITEVKEINSAKLSKRLNEGRRKDEIEQLAITFNQMLSELELVFRNQDEFVSNASHELRTPLAVMIAESDYILNKEREKSEYTDHIRGLVDDLRKLNLLLNGLLEMAHLNRDNKIMLSEIRIDESVFNAIQSVKSKYHGRKILFNIECSDNEDDLLINGNSGLLEIAFRNLIDNACKFSSGEIGIKISRPDHQLIIAISDHGIGIPSAEIQNILKPFTRATNVRYISGFGIGLSIVAKITELHGAEIIVNSKEGEGSCFELKFFK
jgi:two-component system, OmpR family, sensor histidine kinase ArlS